MTRAKDISKIVSDANFGGTLDVAGETTLATHLNMGDGDIIKLGASADLTTQHDGSHSYVKDAGTGNLFLDSVAGSAIIRVNDGYNALEAIGGGAVNISHNGNTKIATTSTGVTVTGNVVINGGVVRGERGTASAPPFTFSDDLDTGMFNISNAHLGFAVGGSERMRITSSGNVGIGTTAPASPSGFGSSSILHLKGSASNDCSIVLEGLYGSGGRQEIGVSSGVLYFNRGAATGSMSTSMVILSGGQIGFGTTSTGVHGYHMKYATGGNAVLKVENGSTSGNTTCYLVSMTSASSNSAFFQGYNGSNNYYLLGNGTHTFTSDENAKKNIETTRDGYLEDLAKLRVVKYNWKDDEDGADKELGLIAQEVEKVFPNLIKEDHQPSTSDGDTRYKMIKASVIPMMLLKAIQELATKNDALEARIATQATQIADLISRVTALEGA